VAEYLKEMENDSSPLFTTIVSEIEKMDTWSSKERVSMEWQHFEQGSLCKDKSIISLIDTRRAAAEGFHFEFGGSYKNLNDYNHVEIEETDKDIRYYYNYLFGKEHVNYLGNSEEDHSVGPVCISVEEINPLQTIEEKKAIIRTRNGSERILIPSEDCISRKAMLKYIRSAFPELAPIKLVKVKLPDFPSKLVEFENQSIFKNYKFGILYVAEGQTDENNMFSNVHTSVQYEEFLDFLGTRIELNGWTKYRGGLDVRSDTTGTHSIYTAYQGYEIMFHVSTLLPFQVEDFQRVERKRHLGNDIVVIIFKEGDQSFDPLILTTHFNHIFVVIQVDSSRSTKQKIFYKIAIANKTGVPPYRPFLRNPPIYEKGNEFRELLLTKLINAERAAMHSPEFKGKMIRTNKSILENLAAEFIPKQKKEQS